MHILLCPDSFKGSLSASEITHVMTKTIESIMPWGTCVQHPLADGGEGTLEAVLKAKRGKAIQCLCSDPLGRPIETFYGDLGEGTALIEMASTAGMGLLHSNEHNPMITSTYGTGQMIGHAVDAGFKKVYVAIGGSSTNDGGAGMAQALGFGLINAQGREIGRGGGALHELNQIVPHTIKDGLSELDVVVACDVNNPLTGPQGASAVYGPQKGATPQMVETLDRNLCHLADHWGKWLGKEVSQVPGAGAAGGMGAGLMAFLDAKVQRGFDMVAEATDLEGALKRADLIITGEGSVDEQTLYGKVVKRVVEKADQFKIPVVIIAGRKTIPQEKFESSMLKYVCTVEEVASSREDAMTNASSYLIEILERQLPLITSSL